MAHIRVQAVEATAVMYIGRRYEGWNLFTAFLRVWGHVPAHPSAALAGGRHGRLRHARRLNAWNLVSLQ